MMSSSSEKSTSKDRSNLPKKLTDQLKGLVKHTRSIKDPFDLEGYLEERSETATELYASEKLEALLRHARSYLTLPDTPRVLYPGCDTDISVADVFGKDRVDHLDLNNDSMNIMKREGYSTIVGDSVEYQSSEPYDVIVFWNSVSTPISLLTQIKPEGYVLANNWHGSANIVSENLGFELVAGFDNDRMYSPGEMNNWIGSDYMQVDREGKIHKLSKEEAGRVEGQAVVESPHAPDNLFVFRKKR